MAKLMIVLEDKHVGHNIIKVGTCSCCGHRLPDLNVTDTIGQVLQTDVGKRAYYNPETQTYRIETDKMRELRINAENYLHSVCGWTIPVIGE